MTDIITSTISVPSRDGTGSFEAYLARPKEGRAPAVVLLQEVFGVNDHIRSVVDRWAREGFLVLAPDMFRRAEPGLRLPYTEEGYIKGRGIRMALDEEALISDVLATMDAARAMDDAQGTAPVAVIGFCWGGQLAWCVAAKGDPCVAVGWYGGGIDARLALVANLQCPVQLHYGGKDPHIPPAAVEKTRAGVAGRDNIEIFVYPDAGHGFNCDARADYHPASAALAHSRALAAVRAAFEKSGG